MNLARWITMHPSAALAVLFVASLAYVAWMFWMFHRARQRPRAVINNPA